MRRRRKASPAPPASPQAAAQSAAAWEAIDAASIMLRTADADGVRAVIHLGGRTAWAHGEATHARLAKLWPALSDAEIRRLTAHIDARISGQLRARQDAGAPVPRGWVHGWRHTDNLFNL